MRVLRYATGITFLILSTQTFGSPITPENHVLDNSPLQKRGTWDDVPNDTYQRFVHKRCSADQVLAERVGWAEAGLLANALYKWVPSTTYQDAVNKYMGTDSLNTGGWFSGTNYKQRLIDTFQKQYKLHAGEAPTRTYTYVYCDENDLSEKVCSDSTGAYEWDEIGYIWTNHYIVLCPYYFQTPTLSAQLQSIKQQPYKAQTINNLYWNQGAIYFHETFHMEATVTEPRALDPAYGPNNVYELALTGNTEKASVNADSYTMTATAIFLQLVFNLASSPIPKEQTASDVTIDSSAPSYAGQTAPTVDPPSNWVSAQNVNDSNSQPDLTVWNMTEALKLDPTDYEFSAPTLVQQNQCNPVSGNKWVVDWTLAAQNAQDFCNQTSNSVEYNQNTVNDLQLTLNNVLNPTLSILSAPDCANNFIGNVINGCDGNNATGNPNNYKYGSNFTTSDGWVYIMEPLAVQIDADNCDVSYKFIYDSFEIRGKNFPPTELGTDGSGLLSQLRGCGDVTDWGFELTPKDPVYQWYANGHLPIGVKSCVGRATESAGGTSVGNCHGAG